MYKDRYINAETDALTEMISESAEQREVYITRPLSSEHFDMVKNKLPFTTLSRATLDDINPLLPKDVFGNKEVAFIKLDDQEYKDVGFVALGQFHENANYKAVAPDSLDLYLARKFFDESDKTMKVRLWRSLKTTPGFETVYKFGNSQSVTKQRIVPGANNDHRGSFAIDTTSYEIIQATRDFLKKAENKTSKEYRILRGIRDEDYSVMDTRSIYKKSDTWSVKLNELANGKLENILFTSSQIHDADFAKTRTSMGEQYMVSKKLNNEVFDLASSGFRRNASQNRINFVKDLNENRSKIYSVEDGKPLDELKALRDRFIEFNVDEFKKRLNVFGDLGKIFKDEKLENSYLENLRTSKTITGAKLERLLSKDRTDYLYKRSGFMKEIYQLLGDEQELERIKRNNKNYTIDFDSFKFKKSDIKRIYEKYKNEYKDIEKELVKEMQERISSKIDSAFDRRYYQYLKSVKPQDRGKIIRAIEMDMTRDFYDKYNEKIDLYEVMVKNRRNTTISEAEAVADRVRFVYEGNNIVDVKPITRNAFDYISDLSKDVDLRWGYYKARNEKGASFFDKQKLEYRLKLAKEYSVKNQSHKDLFKKVSEKSMFGKYDTYDNFNKSKTGEFKYNYLDDAIVARTNDKILAKLNVNNSLDIKGAMRYGDKIFRINLNLTGKDGFNKNDYIKELTSQTQASLKELDIDVQKFIEQQAKTGRKVYKLYSAISKAQGSLKNDRDEYEKLNKMKSTETNMKN